jgi:predicted AlkP superfamily pyrophosphatase or phosphodiesterase
VGQARDTIRPRVVTTEVHGPSSDKEFSGVLNRFSGRSKYFVEHLSLAEINGCFEWELQLFQKLGYKLLNIGMQNELWHHTLNEFPV